MAIATITGIFAEETGFEFVLFTLVLIGFFIWSGYVFYELYEKNSVVKNRANNEVEYTENDLEEDIKSNEKLGFYDQPEDEIAYVNDSPIYQFDYFDSKGNFSQRRIKVQSIERKHGELYLNALDLEKHASRTFKVANMDSLMLEETGEIIDDNQVESHFSGVFSWNRFCYSYYSFHFQFQRLPKNMETSSLMK